MLQDIQRTCYITSDLIFIHNLNENFLNITWDISKLTYLQSLHNESLSQDSLILKTSFQTFGQKKNTNKLNHKEMPC